MSMMFNSSTPYNENVMLHHEINGCKAEITRLHEEINYLKSILHKIIWDNNLAERNWTVRDYERNITVEEYERKRQLDELYQLEQERERMMRADRIYGEFLKGKNYKEENLDENLFKL